MNRKPSASWVAKQISQLQAENKRLLIANVEILYSAPDGLTDAQIVASEQYKSNAQAIESNHAEIIRIRGLR
jgi:hypothetical protein